MDTRIPYADERISGKFDVLIRDAAYFLARKNAYGEQHGMCGDMPVYAEKGMLHHWSMTVEEALEWMAN